MKDPLADESLASDAQKLDERRVFLARGNQFAKVDTHGNGEVLVALRIDEGLLRLPDPPVELAYRGHARAAGLRRDDDPFMLGKIRRQLRRQLLGAPVGSVAQSRFCLVEIALGQRTQQPV